MDPALRELLRRDGRGEIEAIMRLVAPEVAIPGVRVVARFGDVVTCRIPAAEVERVHDDPRCVSLKASRPLGPEPESGDAGPAPLEVLPTDVRRPPGLDLSGAGVVLGLADFDLAFAHPSFLRTPTASRLLGLWDQRGGRTRLSPEPYGYGRYFPAAKIDAALEQPNPYAALQYFPRPGGHGTHVADIAAGADPDGSPGVAPGTDLIFVHLADRSTSGLFRNLGDSVRILEAIDLIARVASPRDWVVNLSAGRVGGPHNGLTLAERGLDNLLRGALGKCVTQSAGNYGNRSLHVEGRVAAGRTVAVTLCTHPDDSTANEAEFWYSGADTFAVRVGSPDRQWTPWVPPGHRQMVPNGYGVVYHAENEPNSGDNYVELFLKPWAPAGAWTIELRGVRIRDGTFHGWAERDEACPHCQAVFAGDLVSPRVSLGTIANSRLPLIVGGVDGTSPEYPIAPFSSRGPTRDCRDKPDLVAPAVNVLAARAPEGREYKSGTSMASPFVAGAVAILLEHTPHLPIAWIRELLRAATVPVPGEPVSLGRQGAGRLDLTKLAAILRDLDRPHSQEGSMNTETPDELYERFLAGVDAPAGYLVVALPGEAPRDRPAPGDRLIRILFGWPGHGRAATLTGEPVLDRSGSTGEPRGPGYYAPVAGDGPEEPAARRVLDGQGRMPHGQLLLRPVPKKGETTAEPQASEEVPANPDLTGLAQIFGLLSRSDLFRNMAGQAGTQQSAAAALQEALQTAQAGSRPKAINPGSRPAEAHAAIAAFVARTNPGKWKLSRAEVAQRLSDLVTDPNEVDQDGLNLCGPAVFLRFWIARDPLAVVRFAAELYETGASRIGDYEVTPDDDSLLGQDYSALKAQAGSAFCPPADWMILGSLRDAENAFFDFEGRPDESVAAATTAGEVADWFRATGLYRNVRNEGNFFLTKGLDHLLNLAPTANRDIALLINAHIIDEANVVNGPKKSSEFILSAFPNHFVALASRVQPAPSDMLEMSFWTWGDPVAKFQFNRALVQDNYYGAVIAER